MQYNPNVKKGDKFKVVNELFSAYQYKKGDVVEFEKHFNSLAFQAKGIRISIGWDEVEPHTEPTKLKELPNTVVHVKTQEEYDELMRIYEDAGWKWFSGDEPTYRNNWHTYEEKTCIKVEDHFSYSYSEVDFYKEEDCKIITFQEFKRIQGIGDYLDNFETRQPVRVIQAGWISKVEPVQTNKRKGIMSMLRNLSTRITLGKSETKFYQLRWIDIDDGEICPTEEGRGAATEYQLLGFESLEAYADSEIKRIKKEEKEAKK